MKHHLIQIGRIYGPTEYLGAARRGQHDRKLPRNAPPGSTWARFKNRFTDLCSGSEAGSYLMLTDSRRGCLTLSWNDLIDGSQIADLPPQPPGRNKIAVLNRFHLNFPLDVEPSLRAQIISRASKYLVLHQNLVDGRVASYDLFRAGNKFLFLTFFSFFEAECCPAVGFVCNRPVSCHAGKEPLVWLEHSAADQ